MASVTAALSRMTGPNVAPIAMASRAATAAVTFWPVLTSRATIHSMWLAAGSRSDGSHCR